MPIATQYLRNILQEHFADRRDIHTDAVLPFVLGKIPRNTLRSYLSNMCKHGEIEITGTIKNEAYRKAIFTYKISALKAGRVSAAAPKITPPPFSDHEAALRLQKALDGIARAGA